MAMGSHQKSNGWDEWLTPPEILAALGPFDLDPCAPIRRPWDMAIHHFTVVDNGLSLPWHGLVFMNPPYGQETGKWLARLAAHGEGIALIFARTETRMFFEYVWPKAHAILFLEGRLHFHYVSGQRAAANSGAPSVLIAYGQECSDRLRKSGLAGKFIELEMVRHG